MKIHNGKRYEQFTISVQYDPEIESTHFIVMDQDNNPVFDTHSLEDVMLHLESSIGGMIRANVG